MAIEKATPRAKRSPWALVRQTFSEWSADRAPELGAALAFYTALSIAPLLVIVLGVAGLALGDEKAVRSQISTEMRSMVGADGGEAIEDMIESANKPTEGIIATALSGVVLLFGASGVFGQLQSSLNRIWKVEPKPGRGVWGMIRDRFLSFTMVLGIAFLLLVSMILSAVLASLGTFLERLPEGFHWLIQGLNFGVSFLVITLLFGMMFKILPDARIAWRDVWLGAAITAALFSVGKVAIGLYLGHSAMASSYGVAGSFVVLLTWVYYSAQILFFGAEFTKAYADAYGSKVVPAENARPLAQADDATPRAAGRLAKPR